MQLTTRLLPKSKIQSTEWQRRSFFQGTSYNNLKLLFIVSSSWMSWWWNYSTPAINIIGLHLLPLWGNGLDSGETWLLWKQAAQINHNKLFSFVPISGLFGDMNKFRTLVFFEEFSLLFLIVTYNPDLQPLRRWIVHSCFIKCALGVYFGFFWWQSFENTSMVGKSRVFLSQTVCSFNIILFSWRQAHWFWASLVLIFLVSFLFVVMV